MTSGADKLRLLSATLIANYLKDIKEQKVT